MAYGKVGKVEHALRLEEIAEKRLDKEVYQILESFLKTGDDMF